MVSEEDEVVVVDSEEDEEVVVEVVTVVITAVATIILVEIMVVDFLEVVAVVVDKTRYDVLLWLPRCSSVAVVCKIFILVVHQLE